MSDYNASDPRSIRLAAKLAKVADAERDVVVAGLMLTPAGRSYVYNLLVRCHVFSSSFNQSALGMAFSEGERNVGLQILVDVMRCAPDQYVQMMREVNDRTIADRRGGDRQNANGRDKQPDGATSSGDAAPIDSDYDPIGDLNTGDDGVEKPSE